MQTSCLDTPSGSSRLEIMPLQSVLGRRLVTFNFLPSRTLHPTRYSQYQSEAFGMALTLMPERAATWHRHWSRRILQHEKLWNRPVTDLNDVHLDLAVLPRCALSALARRLGAVLCAPRLRYAISGAQVRALQAELGPDTLQLARQDTGGRPCIPGEPFSNAEEARKTIDDLGYGVLHAVAVAAPPEIARRFMLKLPIRMACDLPVQYETAMALATSLLTDRGTDAIPD
jgi:type III secretion protein K